jgi:hypothetical protein
VSGSRRILRLAARVAEARRPKRLGAATRLAPLPPAAPSPAEAATVAPAASGVAGPAPERALPLSGEAARWLTHGEIPTDLVPLAGDPALPVAQPQRPTPAPAGADGAGPGRVLSSVVEGVRDAPAASAAPPARPSTTIEELPGPPRHDGPPLMRLARVPQPQAPQPQAPPDRAQELARASGGAVSDDGAGMSTVTFPAAAAAATPSAPATAPPVRGPGPSEPPAAPRGVADLDLDELYEEFLRRLRRDLLHDRERLGDLLGPLR